MYPSTSNHFSRAYHFNLPLTVLRPPSTNYHLTLKMASAQVAETSVTNNSPSQDSNQGTSPIADIINDHGLSYHLYGDDIQLSISLNDIQQVKLRVECCVRDFNEWRIRNYLKLHQDKTDLVVISPRFHPMPDIGHITVGSECIAPCDSVRNPGVQFGSIFSFFEEHIKNV